MEDQELDDLEYHIRFPTPTPELQTVHGTGSITDGTKLLETSVVLIGWMNSQDKYLEKYSLLYEQRGCTTIRYSPKFDDLKTDRSKQVARKLLEVVTEMNLSENAVLFHVFSNGGCMVYRAMLEIISVDTEFQSVKPLGIVFDSAPGKFRLGSRVNAVFSQYPAVFTTYVLKRIYFCYLLVKFSIQSVAALFGYRMEQTVYDFFLNRPCTSPELYLYSKADELIRYKDVAELIEHRKALGADVDQVCWEDSAHVQHLRQHRESYMQQCYNFLIKCYDTL